MIASRIVVASQSRALEIRLSIALLFCSSLRVVKFCGYSHMLSAGFFAKFLNIQVFTMAEKAVSGPPEGSRTFGTISAPPASEPTAHQPVTTLPRRDGGKAAWSLLTAVSLILMVSWGA